MRVEGSKDPNNMVLGSKYYNINDIWALKPCCSGPWTVRVSELKTAKIQKGFGFGVQGLGFGV